MTKPLEKMSVDELRAAYYENTDFGPLGAFEELARRLEEVERRVIRLREGGRMVSEVFKICDAYEAGYGKGQVCSQDDNPFPEGSKEREAWDIGYQTAIKLELDRHGVLPSNG